MRATTEFWHWFGWALLWLGFFGGIALCIWANGVSNNKRLQPENICIQQHGTWTWSDQSFDSYCKFSGTSK